MDNLLNLDWYLQYPIDFEHKQYVLFHYLQQLDQNFYQYKLSPYLLWTEKMLNNMLEQKSLLNHFEEKITKKTFDLQNLKVVPITIKKNKEIEQVIEIIDFSCPLLRQRVELGNDLLKRRPEILY